MQISRFTFYNQKMKFNISLNSTESDVAEIKSKFNEYLNSQFPELPDESQDLILSISVKNNSNRLIAGLIGKIYWNGLEIDTLWVDDNYQRKGIGRQLMNEAENLAMKYGVVVAFLKTVGAKSFYQKLGYEVYGILEDRPIGSLLFHMKKKIK